VIAALLAALAVQGGAWTVRPAAPTVGDTVRLERLVPAPAGVLGRARGLDVSDAIEPLLPPEIVPADGGLRVRYAVAVFAPGRLTLAMPALELVYPDGAVELVLGDTAEITVTSVIPDSVARPAAPRPSLAPVARVTRNPLPLLVLLAGVSAALLLWTVLRRRTGHPASPAPVTDVPPPPLPLMRWIGLGERRAVASLAADRLRRRLEARVPAAARGLPLEDCLTALARERPDWPHSEIEAVLTALDRARFAPLSGDDAAELVDRTDVLLDQLAARDADAPA
jgi:hypothetical protein